MEGATIVFLLTIPVLALSAKEWTDPHDMGIRTTDHVVSDLDPMRNASDLTEKFLQRHVQRLVSVLSVDRVDIIRAMLTMEVSASDASHVKTFLRLKDNATHSERLRSLHDLEETLEKLLNHVTLLDKEAEVGQHSQVLQYIQTFAIDLVVFVPMLIAALLIVLLWRGFPLWKIATLILMFSCAWEWSAMYKKVIVEKHQKFDNPPPQCALDNGSSIVQRLLFTFFTVTPRKECIAYRQALLVDAYLEVTPAMAVIELCSKLCFQPLGHLGEKLGQFFHEVLGANSYLASIGVSLLSLIILVLIILVLGGYTLRLPFFLGSIEPHHRHGREDVDLQLMSEISELKKAVMALIEQSNQVGQLDNDITSTLIEKKAVMALSEQSNQVGQLDNDVTSTLIEKKAVTALSEQSNQVGQLDNESTLIENVTSFAKTSTVNEQEETEIKFNE